MLQHQKFGMLLQEGDWNKGQVPIVPVQSVEAEVETMNSLILFSVAYHCLLVAYILAKL